MSGFVISCIGVVIHTRLDPGLGITRRRDPLSSIYETDYTLECTPFCDFAGQPGAGECTEGLPLLLYGLQMLRTRARQRMAFRCGHDSRE